MALAFTSGTTTRRNRRIERTERRRRMEWSLYVVRYCDVHRTAPLQRRVFVGKRTFARAEFIPDRNRLCHPLFMGKPLTSLVAHIVGQQTLDHRRQVVGGVTAVVLARRLPGCFLHEVCRVEQSAPARRCFSRSAIRAFESRVGAEFEQQTRHFQRHDFRPPRTRRSQHGLRIVQVLGMLRAQGTRAVRIRSARRRWLFATALPSK